MCLHKQLASVLLATLLSSFASRAAAQDTAGVGAVVGSIRTSGGEPALAVTVCLIGTTRCELSDERGHFRIGEVRPGDYRLEVTPPGQPRIESDAVTVRAGLDALVEVTLPRIADIRQEVTVTASAFVAPDEVKTSAFVIQPAEIRNSAGALQDVSRYVQALPGVSIGTNDFRNDLIVRGGSPLENLFIVDNVEIPNINAFANFSSAGGTVSLLDSALIRDVTFLTGGYPAPYGNRVSSVLQVTQREGDRQQFRGTATVGFAGAGGVAEGPLAGGKGSWVASFRRSFLDLVTDDIGVGGVPVLYTFNAKAVVDLNARDRIWVVNVSGVDRVRLGLTETTDLEDGLADFDIRYQGARSATGVNWQRVFGTSGVGLFGVSYSQARVTSTVKDLIRNGVPPPDVPVDDIIDNGTLVFREESREAETIVKYDLTTYLPMDLKLQAGGSVKIVQLDYDTASPYGSDSPYTTEDLVNPFELLTAFTTSLYGGYVQTTKDIGSRMNATVGLRADRFQYLGKTRVAPRAGLGYRVSDAWSLKASYGQFYQQPPFLFLAAFPQNAELDPLRSDHYVGGVTFSPTPATRVSIEAYRKEYRDYPVSSDFPELSLANVGDTFNVRDVLFPMVSVGRGRASGVEFLAERKPGGRWYGQTNLSFARAQHAGSDGVYRSGSYDYPFIFNADGAYQVSVGWQVSARLAWLGGRPYTPFDEAASTDIGRGIFDLDRVNSERTPNYFRLDLRAERAFGVGGERPLFVFFGIQNVTNRKNVAGYDWNRRLGETRMQEQMGIFPILGLEWRF